MTLSEKIRKNKVLLALCLAAIIIALVTFLIVLPKVNPSSLDITQGTNKGNSNSSETTPTGTPGDSSANGSNKPGGSGAKTPISATVLPSDMSPDDWIKEFYYDVISRRFESAYKRLPASMRQTLTLEQFTRQYERDPILSATSEGSPDPSKRNSAVVTSDVVTANKRNSTQIWTFEKQEGRWVLLSRTIKGMPQP